MRHLKSIYSWPSYTREERPTVKEYFFSFYVSFHLSSDQNGTRTKSTPIERKCRDVSRNARRETSPNSRAVRSHLRFTPLRWERLRLDRRLAPLCTARPCFAIRGAAVAVISRELQSQPQSALVICAVFPRQFAAARNCGVAFPRAITRATQT